MPSQRNLQMSQPELDRMDAAIAILEGPRIATLDSRGRAIRHNRMPYKPTRERDEAMRLMDKYITRMVRLTGMWAAVGRNGRAYFGPTSEIAICKAVIGNAAPQT